MVNTLNNLVKAAESIPLSTDDIKDITDGRTNVVIYNQLESVNDIMEILQPYNSFVLLYQFENSDVGHFVACIYYPETGRILHHDSYGYGPDYELEMLGSQQTKHLTRLYRKAIQDGYKLDVNHHRFQRDNQDLQTCGRHAALRVVFRDYNHAQYINLLKQNTFNHADEFVTLMTITSSLNRLNR